MIKSSFFTTFSILAIVLFFPIFTLGWIFFTIIGKKQSKFYIFSRAYAKVLFFSLPGWQVKVKGLENIQKGKNYMVLSNHQSMLDIPLLATLNENLLWVAKQEVLNIPLINFLIKMRGDILIRRGALSDSKRMVKRCRKEIREGVSIVIFPEGTRTKTGRIGKFKEGAFVAAKLSGADILPIVIDGVFDATHPQHYKGLKFPSTLTIHILSPIAIDTIKDMQVKEVKDMVYNTIYNYHKNIRPELYQQDNRE